MSAGLRRAGLQQIGPDLSFVMRMRNIGAVVFYDEPYAGYCFFAISRIFVIITISSCSRCDVMFPARSMMFGAEYT